MQSISRYRFEKSVIISVAIISVIYTDISPIFCISDIGHLTDNIDRPNYSHIIRW
uniref:Uncharacterized protein n=1 Tax=Helianthus annuus TaxID=4232 RepID=A0A251V5L7_HELAN